jgi:hypothetical protein
VQFVKMLFFSILTEMYFKKSHYAYNMTYKRQFIQPKGFGLNCNSCGDNRVLVPKIDSFGVVGVTKTINFWY